MNLAEILQFSDFTLLADLKSTIEIIDNLHRFPAIHTVPVTLTRKRTEQGSYRYRMRPLGPTSIEISRNGTHPQLTLIHEVGHMVDQLALNPLKSEFGSLGNPIFTPLLEAWESSRNVRALIRTLEATGKQLTPVARRYLASHLTPPELFARTYAQWVAVRSGNPLLGSQLINVRTEGSYVANRWLTFQWEDDDFEAIIDVVDRLMESAGLR